MKDISKLKAFLTSYAVFQSEPNSRKEVEDHLKTLESLFEIENKHLAAVHAEVVSAKENWPPFNSAHEGFAVLLEEVDELKKEVWTNQKKRDSQKMYNEARQVAAMAIRFMSEVCDEVTCRK